MRISQLFLSLAITVMTISHLGCSTAKVNQTSDETLYFRGGKCAEHACTLRKDGANNIIVTDEKGQSGYGYLLNDKTIHITGWNNLEGTLSYFDGRISAIYWYNGNNWLQK